MLPQEIRQKEKEIIAELNKQGIRISYRLVRVDAKTKAWEHTIGLFAETTKADIDAFWEIVNKHFREWLKNLS